jgi:hypothetical protein
MEKLGGILKDKSKIVTSILGTLVIGLALTVAALVLNRPSAAKLKAGEFSMSINERNEITLIHRDKLDVITFDSTLTSITSNMLMAKEYAKTNLSQYKN